jgi:hypothetical protein
MYALNPFMDNDVLVRVGGRLANADIDFNSKCPIVLPSKGNVTQLIFEYEHKRLLHIGPQCLLANIHLRYWSSAWTVNFYENSKELYYLFPFKS